MSERKMFLFSRVLRPAAAGSILAALLAVTSAAAAQTAAGDAAPKSLQPFLPGEKLTYTISWSRVFSAGTATMEVKADQSSDGTERYRFLSTARSIGMVDTFYPIRDAVESLYDARHRRSLSYHLDQSHGKRKKKRTLVFDHAAGTVTYSSDGQQEVVEIAEHEQDAFSSLYYLRSRDDLVEGKTIVIPIHDSGKNWSVEVQVLGKETVTTPAGEFRTIKVRTYPKYEGVFMHKGEIYMWLTDDRRRIPVLMKSTITIGSIVATLTALQTGEPAK